MSHNHSICDLLRKSMVILMFLSLLPAAHLFSQKQGNSKLIGSIYDPQLSPFQQIISYERQIGDRRILTFADNRLRFLREIDLSAGQQNQQPDIDLFEFNQLANRKPLGGSFQLNWRPVLDKKNRSWFTFVSSGKNKQYDIYVSYIDKKNNLGNIWQITDDKYVDLYPAWSPDGKTIAFVSSRSGKGDIYLIKNLSELINKKKLNVRLQRLTDNPGEDNHPAWSPDGRYVAYTAMQKDNGRKNYGVNLIRIPEFSGVLPRPIRITKNENRAETRPVWDLNGKGFIAYYSSRPGEGTNRINIGITRVFRDPSNSRIAGASKPGGTPTPYLAENIIPNENRGPVWVPRSKNGSILYVKRDEAHFNPVYVASLQGWLKSKVPFDVKFPLIKDRMNREVKAYATPNGFLVLYASQYGEKGYRLNQKRKRGNFSGIRVAREIDNSLNVANLVPGLAQIRRGEKNRGRILAAAEGLFGLGYLIYVSKNRSAVNDVETLKNQYNNSTLASEIEDLAQQMNRRRDDAISNRNTARLLGGLFLGGLIYHLVTTFRQSAGTVRVPVYSEKSPKGVRFGFSYQPRRSSLLLTTKITF